MSTMRTPGSQIAAFCRVAARNRTLVLATTGLLLALVILLAATTPMREDITALLPDSGSVAEDFRLLGSAPLSDRILIGLHAQDESAANQLPKAVARVKSQLRQDLFSSVISGPPEGLGPLFIEWLMLHAPALLGAADYQDIENRIRPDAIFRQMARNRADLLAPGGIALKKIIRIDPLGLRQILLPKLAALSLAPNMRVKNGNFVTADGRDMLVLATAATPLTDSENAEKIVAILASIQSSLPENITAHITGGHLHSAANASTIQGDLATVLLVSGLLLAALFILFLRNWRAFIALAIPGFALAAGIAAIRLGFASVSGIVIGFGAVLVGICADFALHVYIAVRAQPKEPCLAVSRVTRPVCFGALTSLGAFAALFISDISGIRQLAMFSMAGLVLALLLSLLVLPQLVSGGKPQAATRLGSVPTSRNRWIVGTWAIFLLFCLVAGSTLHINGDLRALGVMDRSALLAEQTLRKSWGGMGEGMLLFTPAADEQQALQTSCQTAKAISQLAPDARLVSPAPVLPPDSVQKERQALWHGFWTSAEGRQALQTIRSAAVSTGFSSPAFDPFLRLATSTGQHITRQSLVDAGLGSMVESLFIPQGNGKIRIMSVLDTDTVSPALQTQLADLAVRTVSRNAVKIGLEQAMKKDVIAFLLASGTAIIVLLGLLFRRTHKVLLALVAPVTGAAAVLAMAGLNGTGLNLFTVTALPIVLGLCTDYGIYMVELCHGHAGREIATATLVSGLTTLCGFGALLLAVHPALHSIGLAVACGVGAALPAALFVIPAFAHRQQGGS